MGKKNNPLSTQLITISPSQTPRLRSCNRERGFWGRVNMPAMVIETFSDAIEQIFIYSQHIESMRIEEIRIKEHSALIHHEIDATVTKEMYKLKLEHEANYCKLQRIFDYIPTDYNQMMQMMVETQHVINAEPDAEKRKDLMVMLGNWQAIYSAEKDKNYQLLNSIL